jgi:hypothetical protein
MTVASATKIVRAMIEEKCRGLQTARPKLVQVVEFDVRRVSFTPQLQPGGCSRL